MLNYIIECNLLLAFLFLVFKRWIRGRMSFHAQRWLLASFVSISLVFPFVFSGRGPQFDSLSFSLWSHHSAMEGTSWGEVEFPRSPVIISDGLGTKHKGQGPEMGFLFLVGYGAMVIYLIAKRLFNLIFWLKKAEKGKVYTIQKIRVFRTDFVKGPCSFFKSVFIPSRSYNSQQLDMILRHEFAHVRQGHTFDLLVVELLRVIFWFNPFITSYLNLFKEIHEFLADHQVLRCGFDRIQYAGLLLASASGIPVEGLLSRLDSSLTKRRIQMIVERKSQKNKKGSSVAFTMGLIMAVGMLSLMPSVWAGQPAAAQAQQPANVGKTSSTNGFAKPDGWFSDWPLSSLRGVVLSSGFGMRKHPISGKKLEHHGIDLATRKGTPIIAPENGEVLDLGKGDKQGKFVVLKHAGAFSTYYAQMDQIAQVEGHPLQKGDSVAKGQVIGYVGSSGVSTGPHLHYEIRKDGKSLDPMTFLEDTAIRTQH